MVILRMIRKPILHSQVYQNNCNLFNPIIQHLDDPTFWEWTPTEAALIVLDRQYKTLNLSLSALIVFNKCHQKNRPFQNFLAKFIGLAKECKKIEEQKVEALKRKISELITV